MVTNANNKVTHGSKYKYNYDWHLHQTEHPKAEQIRSSLEEEDKNKWKHVDAQAYSREKLCRPGVRWYPRDGAVAGYGAEASWKGDDDLKSAQKAGALMFVCMQETLSSNFEKKS